MATSLAMLIINAEDRQAGKGKELYIRTFVNTTFYARFRAETDLILTQEGYERCIVA